MISMNKKINIEFVLGLIILLISFFALITIISKIDIFESSKSFELESSYFDIGTLQIGSDVKINGVKVGVVDNILLNPKTYMAIVKTSYDYDINIPSDSSFKISNNGFIGSPYVEISLGSSNVFLQNKDSTENNIDAISLEEIINNFIFK